MDRIPKDDIIVKEEREKIEEILKEAKIFLFPDIPEEKKGGNYEHMKGIVGNLEEEVSYALTELDEGNWPVFKNAIFGIEEEYRRDVLERLETVEEQLKAVRPEKKVERIDTGPLEISEWESEISDLRGRIEELKEKDRKPENYDLILGKIEEEMPELNMQEIISKYPTEIEEIKERLDKLEEKIEKSGVYEKGRRVIEEEKIPSLEG